MSKTEDSAESQAGEAPDGVAAAKPLADVNTPVIESVFHRYSNHDKNLEKKEVTKALKELTNIEVSETLLDRILLELGAQEKEKVSMDEFYKIFEHVHCTIVSERIGASPASGSTGAGASAEAAGSSKPEQAPSGAQVEQKPLPEKANALREIFNTHGDSKGSDLSAAQAQAALKQVFSSRKADEAKKTGDEPRVDVTLSYGSGASDAQVMEALLRTAFRSDAPRDIQIRSDGSLICIFARRWSWDGFKQAVAELDRIVEPAGTGTARTDAAKSKGDAKASTCSQM
jgi:hypothetical protein